MARNPKGSTPKLTNELIDEIAMLLRRGSYIESAAAACGISKDWGKVTSFTLDKLYHSRSKKFLLLRMD